MSNRNREKNYADLKLLMDVFACPDIGIKLLNTVYAFRNAFAARGYLVARERKILIKMASKHKSLADVWSPEVAEKPKKKVAMVTPRQSKKGAHR